MKITDIIALAKAGYKASDVKELLEAEDPTPEVVEEKSGDENTPDYKRLYEDTLAKLEEAQKANRKEPMPKVEEKDLSDALAKALGC